jgi:DNA-binding Xre family transcriptional regulator
VPSSRREVAVKIVSKALQLRLEKGRTENRVVSQEEVAEAIDITRTTLRRIERGDTKGIDFETLAKLCNYYGVGVGAILEYDPNNTRAVEPVFA